MPGGLARSRTQVGNFSLGNEIDEIDGVRSAGPGPLNFNLRKPNLLHCSPMKVLLAVSAAFVMLMAAAAGGMSVVSGWATSLGAPPSADALQSIPPSILGYYEAAATTCPGMAWQLLAAIGTLESSNGQSNAPGVHSGLNYAGLAAGPMQFEPATFAEYDHPIAQDSAPTPVPPGISPPDIYDPVDSVYAAARYMCALGAADPSQVPSALFQYSGGSDSYVQKALLLASQYTGATSTSEAGNSAGAGQIGTIVQTGLSGLTGGAYSASAMHAVLFAESALGTPYVWGGNGPGGFDCSGLVWAAYEGTPAQFPRLGAADEYNATNPLPPSQSPTPGDLVFFADASGIQHVGIYVGNGQMIDAPHSGSVVRFDPFTPSPGALWGDEWYVGASAPGSTS